MRVLVTGASGMLGRAVAARARAAGHEVHATPREQLDVTDATAVDRQFERLQPRVVVHCAAYTRVDDAESNEARAHAVNAEATAGVASAANRVNATLVYPSTDYVFNGASARPYRPDDATAPVNAYGRSKLAGELAARGAQRHLIVRTSWLYGHGGQNFVSTVLQRRRAGDTLRVVDDQHGSPTWTEDLADALVQLIELGATGTLHYSNAGQTTWYELARTALRLSGLPDRIQPVSTAELNPRAPRPAYSVLDCSATAALLGPIRRWEHALADALRAGL